MADNNSARTSPNASPGEDDDEFGTPMQVAGFASAEELPQPTNLDGVFDNPPPIVRPTDPGDVAAVQQAAGVATAVEMAVAEDTPGSRTRGAKRKSPKGTTTARALKKSKDQTKMKVGCRVYSQRKNLFLCGRCSDKQKDMMVELPNNFRLYGTVASGKANKGYTVDFDLFPVDEKRVSGQMRNRLTVMAPGAEEAELPSQQQVILEEQQEQERKEAKMDPYTKSFVDFLRMDKEDVKASTLFEMKLSDDKTIEWEILPDGVDVTDQPLQYPETLATKKEVNFDKDTLDTILFHDFLPEVKGHGALLDKFFSDIRAPYHSTVKDEGFVFHQEGEDDCDWAVKQCYLLLIAAVTEPEIGIDNLWRRGQSRGRHKHADFGRYIPLNMFKAFCSAAPLMYCEEKWWYADKRDKDWEVFTPVLDSFNKKRKDRFVLQQLEQNIQDKTRCYCTV